MYRIPSVYRNVKFPIKASVGRTVVVVEEIVVVVGGMVVVVGGMVVVVDVELLPPPPPPQPNNTQRENEKKVQKTYASELLKSFFKVTSSRSGKYGDIINNVYDDINT